MFKPVELRGKLYFPVVVVCNLLVSPSQSQGGKASGSELWHFWAGRAAGLCVHGRKHSPPALALVLPRERALQNKAGRFNLIPCAETSSHGFEERCLVYGSLPFLSKLLTWKIFGAGRYKLSSLSPRTVNGVDEACHLCTWFDVVLVIVCHRLSGLG